MGMSVGPASGDSDPMVEMNTTPLIDVMLVLLVMLIVTIPVQKQAVKLDMPRPNNSKPTAPPWLSNSKSTSTARSCGTATSFPTMA